MATTFAQWATKNGVVPPPPNSGGAYPVYSGAPTPPKSKRGSRNQGILSSLISEVSGAGGAATGAAIGSFLGPVGTVVGAGIGGLVGGTGGRLAENKIRDDEFRLGDALKEGAVSGALSGAGAGFQAFKGARAAKGLSNVLGSGADDATKLATMQRVNPQELYRMSQAGLIDPKDVTYALNNAGAISGAAPRTVQTAAKTVPKLGMIENKGLGMTSKVGGYFTGATVPGAQPLSPSKVKYYDDLLRKLKIPANDASDLAKGIEGRLVDVSNRLTNTIARENLAVTKSEIDDLGKAIISRVSSAPGLRANATKEAQEQVAKLSQVKDARGLLEFRKQLDKFINFNANPDAATAQSQGVARIIRETLKDKTNKLLPSLSRENNLYHDLSSVQDYVLKAANRGATSTTGGQGLFGTIASSPTANTLKAKTGSALQSVGRVTAGTGGPLTKVSQQLKIQSPGSLTRALGGTMQPPVEDPNMLGAEQGYGEPMPGELGYNETPYLPDGISGPLDPQTLQPVQQSPYSLQQALADIQRDPANASDYMKYYDFVTEATAGPDVKVTAQEKKAQAQAKTAMNGLQQLRSLYSEAGGGAGRAQGILGNLIGKAGGNSKANSYNQIRKSLTTSLARALGETGVLTDQDREVYLQALPRLEDNPEEAEIKLRYLEDMLSESSSATYGSDLSTAMGRRY